jgi:hypothetical protein
LSGRTLSDRQGIPLTGRIDSPGTGRWRRSPITSRKKHRKSCSPPKRAKASGVRSREATGVVKPIPLERLDPMESLYKETFLRKPRPPKRFRRWYWPHGLHYIADGGASLLIPLFITDVLRGNVGHVGVVSAVGSMASVPASVGWGEMSDRLRRRKPFIILGYVGAGILFLLMGLTSFVEQF